MYRTILRPIFLLAVMGLVSGQLIAQQERVQASCPMNIVIALDFSGSERAYLDEIRTVLLALTSSYELSETNLKIGIITFNRGAQRILPLTGETHKLDAAIEELRIPTTVYATDIHSAIEMANEEFRLRSIVGVPKFFVLVSDGDPHAHSRGYGFQEDLVNIDLLKAGDPDNEVEPVHVFTLYTGRLSPFQNRFSEEVRRASIRHMQTMASDPGSFFFYEQYPLLVEYFERIAHCL
ncbi:MAG: VWA domain-containing protein [Saprospiraceae bacterium]|nr:VWA domain-containing protein [Lewinella sp.]